jgi:CheY-like chemotaxis protein
MRTVAQQPAHGSDMTAASTVLDSLAGGTPARASPVQGMCRSGRMKSMASEHRSAPRRRHRIVLADDDAAFRELLAALLRLDPEFELAGVAKDGFEAIDLVQGERPDLLLLDLAMPRLGGLEVMERLEAAGVKVKIVIVSGYRDPLFEAAARRLGARDYLVKGTLPEDALDRIRDACCA